MANTRVEVAGLRFKNPILTAAGPGSKDGMTLLSAAAGGAGGLVAKTVSVKPAKVPRPNMSALGSGRVASRRGLLNAELWSELSVERWLEKEYAIALSSGLPLIASVGYTPDEVTEIGPKVVDAGVHAIEFSTHYVGGHREIAEALREAVDVPIFAKLSPRVDVSAVATAIEPFVDGFVAINTYGPCLRIDVETGRPTLGSENGYGWLSGAALKPIALRCVADIAKSVEKPVIGVGGVSSGEDAIEFFMAGAHLVQVCTAAILNGDTIYGQIAREVSEWLDKHDYGSVEEVRAMALPHIRDNESLSPPAEVNTEMCTLCGLCPKSCVYDAITLDRENEVLTIDPKKCAGCGLCVTVCPEHALSLRF